MPQQTLLVPSRPSRRRHGSWARPPWPQDRPSPRPQGTVRCSPRRKIPNPAGWLEPNLGRGKPPQARKPRRTLPPVPASDCAARGRVCRGWGGRVRRRLPAPLGRLAGRGPLVGRRPAVRPAAAGRDEAVRGRRPPARRRCGRRHRRRRPHGAVGEPGRPELDAGGGARPGRPSQRRGPRRQPGPAGAGGANAGRAATAPGPPRALSRVTAERRKWS